VNSHQILQGPIMQHFVERRKKKINPEDVFKIRIKNFAVGFLYGCGFVASILLVIYYTPM